MARIKGVPGGPTTRAASPAAGRIGRIGAWCYDHRRSVLLGWVIGVIAIIAVASAAGSRFRDDFGGVGQSGQVSSILDQRFPAQAGDSAQVVFRSSAPIRSPGVTARVGQVLAAVRALPSVTSVSPLVTARDGHTALSTRAVLFVTGHLGRRAAGALSTQRRPVRGSASPCGGQC